MKNREISEILNEIADILEIQDVQWKPRAYRSAARKIENMSENVQDIYKKKGKKGLEAIPTVGSGLSDHIAELIENGKVAKWEKLKKESGKGINELLNIEGLGPNKVKQLSKELGIKSLKDLRKAIEDKKIRKLEGFGQKTEENVLNSILQYGKSRERMLLGNAWTLAWETINYLKKNSDISKIDFAGSLRRMKETVGDIDILVVTKNPNKLMDSFSSMPNVSRVLVKGKTKTSVVLTEGINVDVRTVEAKSYGSAMQYFTGSKDHNIALRKVAVSKGYKLSEYGLFSKKTNRQLAGKTEKEVYNKLGFEWIPPELRENRDELQGKKVPKLVELKDVRGDLQMHTTYSDGYDTIRDMARAAKKRGYEYIAITDHSKSERIAKGMEEDEIKKQWKEISRIAGEEKIKILKGAEVDILPDGKLDYPKEILKKLDIVLAAVHSRFKSSKKEMTERILKGLDNEHVNIFAHPTGRIVNRREGYNADFEKIFERCKENKIALEINCDPHRLDLNDTKILSAKEHGVKFSLGTDAHHKERLDNMRFGVGQARRGWLKREDIINTLSYEKLTKFLKK